MIDEKLKEKVIEELSNILSITRTIGDDKSTQIYTLLMGAIKRNTTQNDQHLRIAEDYVKKATEKDPILYTHDLQHLQGVVEALLMEYSFGYLTDISETIHADMFSDYLEMAEHLLVEQKNKDAAAVIIGSSLEAHLRKMCEKNSIETKRINGKGKETNIKSANLNEALYKEKVHSKSEKMETTGYLAIRNDAAHGEYEKYEASQVLNMLNGVRSYMNRHPA